MNLVSIIIPTYNNANTICRSVDSCINQTYKNIEIIVIDDGSTDNTKEVLSKYNKDERFKYIYQENQERSAARNHGLDVAKGEYIQFLDSDDEIYPKKIEKQVNFLDANREYFLVYCGLEYKDEGNIVISTLEKEYQGNVDIQLLKGNFLAINTPLFRKNDTRFSIDLNKLEDWEYWISSTMNKRIYYIDEILCTVTVNVQITNKYLLNMLKGEINLYTKLLKKNDFKRYRLLLVLQKLNRLRVYILKKLEGSHES